MLQEKNPFELDFNVFQTIGKEWLLITAKQGGRVNTMTASWGGMGIMWGKPVAYLFIRPQRYTKELIDSGDTLSVSVMPERFRKELSYFGSASGRNEDKIGKAGLKLEEENDIPYFSDARLVFLGKKLYVQPLEADCFVSKEADAAWYPEKDYHVLYVVEIEKAMEQ